MKKYLVKCALMAAAVALPFALWLGWMLHLPDPMNRSIAATIRYKADLLQQTESPRVIFAGGSSSPYGTNCQMVADELGVNAICVGATAYLGLDFYIKLLDTYTMPGDIVVLAPENSLLRGCAPSYSLVWMGAGTDPDVWRCVPLSYLPGLFTTAADYGRLKREVMTPSSAGYNEAFGPLGDVTMERTSLLEQGYNTLDLFDLTPDTVDRDVLTAINRFAARMNRRGITVLFAFAPTDRLAVVSTPEQVAAYQDAIIEELNIPVILTQEQALMDGNYFYDSNNHLTSEGAVINTQNLIDGLRPYVEAMQG